MLGEEHAAALAQGALGGSLSPRKQELERQLEEHKAAAAEHLRRCQVAQAQLEEAWAETTGAQEALQAHLDNMTEIETAANAKVFSLVDSCSYWWILVLVGGFLFLLVDSCSRLWISVLIGGFLLSLVDSCFFWWIPVFITGFVFSLVDSCCP
jgi:hypothetical protein